MAGTTDAARLQRTPLFDWHQQAGASMHEFAGYAMPIQYTGIFAEHLATRAAAGLFDISHMGRFAVRGAQALPFLRRALSNDAARLPPAGGAQYTMLADEGGAAIDDAFLYCGGPESYLLVVNAANRARDWSWLEQLAGEFPGVELHDATQELAMLALQGPAAERVLAAVLARHGRDELPPCRRHAVGTVRYAGVQMLVARTGYTGEPLSLELFLPPASAQAIWTDLLEAGAAAGVRPVGLGARDTLRLEAGLPLYGHELGMGPDGAPVPIGALLELAARAVNLDDPQRRFVGRAALARQRRETAARRQGAGGAASWRPDERSVPYVVRRVAVLDAAAAAPGQNPVRQGHRVYLDDEPVGWITSGTVVPFWRRGGGGPEGEDPAGRRAIAMAYVDARLASASPAVRLAVDKGRGLRVPAVLVPTHLRVEGERVRAVLYPRGEPA